MMMTSARPLTPRLIAATAAAVGLLSVATFGGGCSVPVDETATPLESDDLNDALLNTTTTTSTTTVPDTAAEGTVADATTTTLSPAFETEPITIYYTIGSTGRMQAVRRQLVSPVPPAQIVSQLERPTDLASQNLRTSVRPGLIDDIASERATAIVALDPVVLDRMSNSEQRRAVAQIVLTLTSFRVPGEGNIGFVVFEVGGDPFPVYVPAFGGASEPGEPLAFEEFASLVVGDEVTTTPAVESSPAPLPGEPDETGGPGAPGDDVDPDDPADTTDPG